MVYRFYGEPLQKNIEEPLNFEGPTKPLWKLIIDFHIF